MNSDSLNEIINRINASEAGVTVSLDDKGQRVSIVSNDTEDQLVLDSNGTDFFSALKITDGTYDITPNTLRKRGVSSNQAKMIVQAVEDTAEALNRIFDDSILYSSPTEFLIQLRNNIKGVVSDAYDSDGSKFQTDFGVNFDFQNKKIFDFSGSNQNKLTDALIKRSGFRRVVNLFLSGWSPDDKGLIDELMVTLKKAESDLKSLIESTGSIVNIQA